MWIILSRVAVALSVVLMGKQLVDFINGSIKVSPNQIYSVKETAKLLKIDKNEVLKLIRSKKLKARLVGKGFRISGKNLVDFIERT